MRYNDQRIYRTFEEFEREELRRMETMSASVDEIVETLFDEEIEKVGRRRSGWGEDEDE
jgi:hypothetical protein